MGQRVGKPQWLIKCIAAVESVQVELHGKYSVERAMALYAYQRKFSFWRCLAVVLVTPPRLTVIILSDIVPLNSPDEGLSNNLVFWARVLLVVVCISLTVLEQERRFVPGLPCSTTFLWAMSIMISVGATSFGYMLSYFTHRDCRRNGFSHEVNNWLEKTSVFEMVEMIVESSSVECEAGRHFVETRQHDS